MARDPDTASQSLLDQQDVPLGELSTSEATSERAAHLLKRRSLLSRRYVAIYDHLRKNDLLLSLGLLELANATDFAANVWNGKPPPTISIVFMALGGTAALLILAFACRDVPRTWHNIVLLRQERHTLRRRQAELAASAGEIPQDGLTERDILVHGDVNTRELGNEAVDRLAMGLALGFGALTVGAGTYLAIAGANPRAFLASNILTGYLGNVPAALYGLGNTAWCIYGWRRAQTHVKAARSFIRLQGTWAKQVDISELLRMRESRVKTHAIVNGWSGILGGAGSLMTASAYIHPHAVWGYLLLIPCIISAVFANLMWRYRINYDREMTEPAGLDAAELLNETSHAALRESLVLQYCHSIRARWVPWRSRRCLKDASVSRERLRSFLARYHDLADQKLGAKADIVDRTAGEAEAAPAQIETLHKVRSRLRAAEAGAADSATSVMNLEATVTARDLLVDLIAVLVDLKVFASLLAHPANDPPAAQILNLSGRSDLIAFKMSPKGLENSRMECDDEALIHVLRLALNTLINEGAQAASSRTRYLLELVGCYFQDRAG